MKKQLFAGFLVLLVVVVVGVFVSSPEIEERPFGAGGFTDINSFSSSSLHTTTTLATNAVNVLSRNNGRRYALIVNDSDTDLYLFLKNFDDQSAASTTVVRNRGFRLNASGGSYEILPENLWTGDIWVASTTAAGKRLIIHQGL